MKILLFGSTGMFGTAVDIVCKEREIECVGLSHKDIEITDLDKLENIIERENPDIVINSVAVVGINQAKEDEDYTFRVNTFAPSLMSTICNKKGIIFIYISTHSVFDGKGNIEYTESDEPCPNNIYGISKYLGEIHTENICKKYYIIRFPTLFGPRRNNRNGFVDKMLNMIKEGKEISVATDKMDTPSYTLDLANTLIDMIWNNASYGIYHLCNSGHASLYELIEEAVDILGIDAKLNKGKDSDFPSKDNSPLYTVMISEKLDSMRHWKMALKEYLERYYEKDSV